MRFKLLWILALSLLASLGFAQDINRASEWKTKRPEQSAAKVETEMTMNGTVAPKGLDPSVLDQNGNPVSSKSKQPDNTHSTQSRDAEAVRSQSERLTEANFGIAGASIAQEERRRASPMMVGGIFLFVGGLLVLAFRILTKRIEVPEEPLSG
jgi:hypothetical protein